MILCVGLTPVLQRTMVFEQVRRDRVNRAIDVRETASGKVINVARVVHRLAGDAIASGFLGGSAGSLIRADLDRAGVGHDFVEVEPQTRTCVTVIDRADSSATELVEESKAVEASAWPALRKRIETHLDRANLLVLSGSLTPGAPVDFHAEYITAAKQRKIETIVDASGEPLLRALEANPLIVKPNRSELAAALGLSIDSDVALRDAMRQLIARGARWALVTCGREGALLSHGRHFWRFRSPEVRALNPIGSGDSLAAGLAIGIVRGQSIPEACKFGVACGAANATTLTPADVEGDLVAQLLDQVEEEG
jgi:tagatose 6-phosphate kinase